MVKIKKIILVFTICLLLKLNFSYAHPQIDWLISQQNAITGLVDSYEGDGQNYAYTYDQALAIIAFTEANEIQRAKNILNRMQSLQLSNGAWYQCYNAANGNLGHGGCNHYPTGDISWMLMAINLYESRIKDDSYSQTAIKALNWLDTVRNTNPSEEIYGSLDLCRGVACTYPNAISTENNYDAYSAYYFRGIIEGNYSLIEKANLIKNYLIKEMWSNSSESNGPYHNVGVFWVGYNDFGWYTDPQSWGILALGQYGPNNESFTRALEWLYTYGYGSTRHNETYNPGLDGFDFYTKQILNSIWLEGTEGVAAAYYSIGDNEKGDYFHSQTKKLIANNGGIIYSFSETDPSSIRWNENFRHNSIASTAWYYFNEKKINPFQPLTRQSFNISLFKGWNLVSIPLKLENKTLPNPLRSIYGNYSKILTYDKQWKELKDKDLLNEELGFWINITNRDTLQVKGYELNRFNLRKGWNLISYPSLNPSPIQILEPVNNSVIYSYNGSWLSYAPNRAFNSLTTMKPGYGYWVKTE